MDHDRAGGAVAFSVEYAQRYGQRRNRTALPLCLLRVERRRSDRHMWERTFDELTEVHPLHFVSQLERHRFEYRLSLRSCDDPLVLAFPSELRALRIQGRTRYPHPHVGTFQLVKMEPPPQLPMVAMYYFPGSIIWPLIVVASLVGMCLLLMTKNRLQRWMQFKSKALVTLIKPQTQGSSLQTDVNERFDISSRMSAGLVGSPRKVAVFEDFDEDDGAEADVAKELLMTELPDFSDETGWRDFFDSQIYRRDEHQKHPEHQEASKAVRQQRKLITRSSNSAESSTADQSKSYVAAQAQQQIYFPPTAVSTELCGASRTSAPRQSVVSSALNAASLRQPTSCDIQAETVAQSGRVAATTASSTSIKKQPNRVIRPSTPPNDFGEFWQM